MNPWNIPLKIQDCRYCGGKLIELTPTEFNRRRRQVKEDLRRLRDEVKAYRAMRDTAEASGDQWDLDEAAGRLGNIKQDHRTARITLMWLRQVPVRKYAHVSPSAERRLRGYVDVRL